MKTCEICGKTLTGRQSRYCGPACGQKAYLKRKKAGETSHAHTPQPHPQRPIDPITRALMAASVQAQAELDQLKTLRLRLAQELDECDTPAVVATLSARLMDVIEKIEAREKTTTMKGSVLDDLANRRRARQTG